MSIYGKGIGLNLDMGKAKTAAIAVLVVIFVVLAAFAVSSIFAQPPLAISYSSNPWIQDEQSSILLSAKFVNTTGKDVKLSVLSVKPRSGSSLLIFPKLAAVSETLAPNDSRTLTFNIRNAQPSEKLSPGKYTLDLKLSMDGKEFLQETVLEVQ